MKWTLQEAITHRRTYYNLGKSSPLSDKELIQLVTTAIKQVPSAFNSQSTRIILLLHQQHVRFWELTKQILQQEIPASAFIKTEEKINKAFASGYGTILFYEDQETIKQLQDQFPTYSKAFPDYAEHTSAMHQYALWMMLEEAGYGASLQHYNPLVDKIIAKEWNINPHWRLIAQMPFGSPEKEAGPKEYLPVETRFKVFQ